MDEINGSNIEVNTQKETENILDDLNVAFTLKHLELFEKSMKALKA